MTPRIRLSMAARALGATFAFAAALAWGSPVMADPVKEGEVLAEKLCAKCHVVGDRIGPPFAEIAKGAHASTSSLGDFLRTTHADLGHPNAMPTPELTEQQIDALAAYIASLRGEP